MEKTKEKSGERRGGGVRARTPIIEVPEGHVIVSRDWLEGILEELKDVRAVRRARRAKKLYTLAQVKRDLKRDGKI